MDILRERLRVRGAHCPCGPSGGGGGNSSSTSETKTTNIDKRVAVSDGVGLSGDSNSITYNSSSYSSNNDPDVVKALAQAGSDILKSSGAAVVDLNKNAMNANVNLYDKTLTAGVTLVDKLIDKVGDGFSLGEKAIDSFQPSENKQTDALKYGLIAAAVVAGAVLLKREEKKA